tara:strand:+ start:128 stop:856 length:729 start_codon:yes stop_codon:yes gene_type:complete
MNLCIDIGNSRIKAGFFNNSELVGVEIVHSKLSPSIISDWVSQYKVQHIILSTVRNLSDIDIKILSSSFDITIADKNIPTPFKISYLTPSTLGVDRILGAIGAQCLFPNEDTLSIDAGTCITYDIVENNTFLGGAISPGIQMRLNALHHFTDKLPELEFSDKLVTFGDSTSSCMYMGAEQGVIHEFNGFLSQFLERFPKLKVLLTGGDSTFFERHAENAIFAAPNLVLLGLNSTLLETKQIK